MQVKRFTAPTMQEALKAVREELGEDAVILKSEKVVNSNFFDFNKKDMIEVVAAVDPDETPKKTSQSNPTGNGGKLSYFAEKAEFPKMLHQSMKKGGGSPAKRPVKKAAVQNTSNAVRPKTAVKARSSARSNPQDTQLQDLKAEVNELRSLIRNMSAPKLDPMQAFSMREFADMPSNLAFEMMGMIESGVEKHVAKVLIEKVASSLSIDELQQQEALRAGIVDHMSRLIKTSGPIECKKGKSKVIALVGPTGVGKTTTLAKLAANSKFMFNKKVALISADTYRMSAIEHLNTFAGIAQLPISAIYSPDELKSTLAAHQDKDLIFIDTAGRSPKDDVHLQELKKFMECAQPDEIHLVIPANIKNMDLFNVIKRFGILPLNRIVISKVDETSSLGSVMNIAFEVDKPISYITNGQTIPDDIELASAQNLAKLILKAA